MRLFATGIARAAAFGSSLVLLTGAVVAGTASAADATPRVNRCGSGYAFLKSWPIKVDSGSDRKGRTVGYFDIYYNRRSGKNCAVARPRDGVSRPRDINILLRNSRTREMGLDGHQRRVSYTKYAGPVYVAAYRTCVDFMGGFSYNDPRKPALAYSRYMRRHCG